MQTIMFLFKCVCVCMCDMFNRHIKLVVYKKFFKVDMYEKVSFWFDLSKKKI